MTVFITWISVNTNHANKARVFFSSLKLHFPFFLRCMTYFHFILFNKAVLVERDEKTYCQQYYFLKKQIGNCPLMEKETFAELLIEPQL